jgi:tripartite-type tricarboxylate transporter receptor subunit TctC
MKKKTMTKKNNSTMKFKRRDILQIGGGFAAALALPAGAFAQTYPTRPVRLMVGFPPGSASDINARLVAQAMSERLGQQIVVENKPGAASNIATEYVVRAAPDGYTLLYVVPPNAINATLYKSLDYDFLRDIVPVAGIVRTPGVMEVNLSVPAKTVPEFIAYAKANPGKINMATLGPGSGQHLFGELFMMLTGTALVPVHYHGAMQAITDLIGGRVQVMFDIVVSSLGYLKDGKLRPLAVTTAAPIEDLPGVPPLAQFVPGYEAYGFQGLGAPAKTPAAIVDTLNQAVNAVLADPKLKAQLAKLGGEPFSTSPSGFGQFLVEETAKWGKVVKAANISAG